MTLSLHLHPVTVWLLVAAGALLILGPVLAAITGPWLEIGALMPWAICWVLAAVAFILAIGSLL